MDTLHPDFERMNEIHERARVQAEALRRAAMDDFWRGANAALATAAGGALRSAWRLAYRLQRHRPLARDPA